MTIARQLNGLFIATAACVCVVFSLYSAATAYSALLGKVSGEAESLVSGQPQLQYEIYRADKSSLELTLEEFLSIEAIVAASSFDSVSELLSEVSVPGSGLPRSPRLVDLRQGIETSAVGLVSLDENGRHLGTGFVSSLLDRDVPIYLSIPVLSAANPTAPGLTAADFAAGILERGENRSRVVMGYLNVAIDRAVLIEAATGHALQVLLLMAMVMALGALCLRFALSRTIQPISRLKQLAHALAEGEEGVKVEIPDNSEFADIAKALNKFLTSSRKQQSEMSYEKNMFRLKAERSEEELSQRDKELSRISDEYAASKDTIRKLSSFDGLTELPNRYLFVEHVRRLITLAERDGEVAALLCISLVNFERVKESLGRSTGDLLLRDVASKLVGCLRSSDVLGHYRNMGQRINVSRLGADEFAIVLNRLEKKEDALEVARRITQLLSEPSNIDGHELTASPVIGIAITPDDSSDVETLLRYASAAKQQAAASYKTNLLCYSGDMHLQDDEDFRLATALRKALANNEFTLSYQPQIDTVTGSISSAEAFLRWEHPEHGQVSPFRFIPLAEESGLIVELGNWVLEEACRQMSEFRQSGAKLPRVALNVSPQQLSHEFVARIRTVLKAYDLPAERLELGLSEEIIANDDGSNQTVLHDLKRMGLHIALENFGTTPSSLVYVSRYPLDDLRIDRSFVADCAQRAEGARLVSAVVAMADSLDLSPVAEGVETEEEFQFLSELGVRTMRGYLFSKPIPGQELRQQLVAPWHYMEQIQGMNGIARRA